MALGDGTGTYYAEPFRLHLPHRSMPLRIAHRGMPRRLRENTLPGFALAIGLGADGIELDVHATRDGDVVVHHDATLADGAAIATLTRDELAAREAAPGVPIPSLLDVCRAVAGRAELFVEIKGEGIERLVLDVLQGYRGVVALHSFDHATIARLNAADCPYRLGILFEQRIHGLAEAMDRTGALDIWPHSSLVTSGLVDAVHVRGGRVIPWTVNDAAVARRLTAMGVDALCGDDITIFAT
jgi:glycerophosphoryl diester phosphodiesterase